MIVVSSAARIRLTHGAVTLIAALLSVFLFAMQVANASACLTTPEAPVGALATGSPAHDSEGDAEDCEERALFADGFPKVEDAKPALILTQRGEPSGAIPEQLLNQATRGVPPRRDKAPLFLQTARLRN